jgi:hypothetical protein
MDTRKQQTFSMDMRYAIKAGVQGRLIQPRLEARSNTSTVALRVVGGDEKGTQCLGV